MAGFLPFSEKDLPGLYRKVSNIFFSGNVHGLLALFAHLSGIGVIHMLFCVNYWLLTNNGFSLES